MPELDGLEFAKSVNTDTRIVFTTAFSQYAVDGYRVNALDYLLKPFGYKDFRESSDRALEWFTLKNAQTQTPEAEAPQTEECIYVKSEYKLIQIHLSDILYIEGLKDYVKIYTESISRPILSLCSMKSMEERLPSDRFMRVHRSYIVSKQKVRVIDRGRIVFGKASIPVSDSYKQDWQSFLNERAL
jgi:DNA-binding LytR/AlgR family response regulator